MALPAFLEQTLKAKSPDSSGARSLDRRSWKIKLAIAVGILLLLSLIFFVLTEPLSYPKNVSVSNVSSSSITLSWTTDLATPTKVSLVEPGILQYLPAFLYSSIGDDRDRNGKLEKKYLTHYVTLNNLKPNTRYLARIYVGVRQVYEQKLTTGPRVALQSPNLVYGKIVDAQKKGAEGVLVYLRLQQSQSSSSALLSAITNNQGKWSIETSNARVRNLQKSFDWSKASYEVLVADDGKGNRFSATTNSKADKPWPNIVLQASSSANIKE
jgi:hypothetical protein